MNYYELSQTVAPVVAAVLDEVLLLEQINAPPDV